MGSNWTVGSMWELMMNRIWALLKELKGIKIIFRCISTPLVGIQTWKVTSFSLKAKNQPLSYYVVLCTIVSKDAKSEEKNGLPHRLMQGFVTQFTCCHSGLCSQHAVHTSPAAYTSGSDVIMWSSTCRPPSSASANWIGENEKNPLSTIKYQHVINSLCSQRGDKHK